MSKKNRVARLKERAKILRLRLHRVQCELARCESRLKTLGEKNSSGDLHTLSEDVLKLAICDHVKKVNMQTQMLLQIADSSSTLREYDGAVACPVCGSSMLMAVHNYGAKIVCKQCRHEGPFVRGTNYQEEQRAAIYQWNIAAKGWK